MYVRGPWSGSKLRRLGTSKKSKKSPISQKNRMTPIDILRGHRGHCPRSPCKVLRLDSFCELVTVRTNKFSFWGADPQMGVGIPARHGGICSARGVLQYRVEISAKISKMGEILRGKEKHLAPPSGQPESRRPASGRKYSSGPRDLQLL